MKTNAWFKTSQKHFTQYPTKWNDITYCIGRDATFILYDLKNEWTGEIVTPNDEWNINRANHAIDILNTALHTVSFGSFNRDQFLSALKSLKTQKLERRFKLFCTSLGYATLVCENTSIEIAYYGKAFMIDFDTRDNITEMIKGLDETVYVYAFEKPYQSGRDIHPDSIIIFGNNSRYSACYCDHKYTNFQQYWQQKEPNQTFKE